jgi:L-seryl-tRNA(Ser) seleniumtransferase
VIENDNQRRKLPGVDQILRAPQLAFLVRQWGLATVANAIRSIQISERDRSHLSSWAMEPEHYLEPITTWLRTHVGHGYETVFNLTGTVIHTNLGRSLLSEQLMAEAVRVATRPTTLEYDLRTGRRGQRENIVEHRLKLLTGCEAATIVNNNAAAVLLVLNTLAHNKSVPVSRGELIEIGGSFRLPDIMERAGCRLVEIGTTNRTRLSDYANAIDENTAMLLKVHPSNFHIEGFTEAVATRDLKELGEKSGLPVIEDIGSGALFDLARFGLPHEPTPREVLDQGADIVTFSGDKLLGGIQAGVIVGSIALIERIKDNPLKRALRADKITLAILDATLKTYEDPDTIREKIPLLQTLTLPRKTLAHRGKVLSKLLQEQLDDFTIEVVDSKTQIGSGALPDRLIDSLAIQISHAVPREIRGLASKLRNLNPPVIGRVQDDTLLLDLRGAEPMEELTRALEDLT